LKREWLIKILNDKQLTHQEAAEQSGIERPYFTQIVNGVRRPSPDKAQKIAKALSFDCYFFFDNKSNDTKH